MPAIVMLGCRRSSTFVGSVKNVSICNPGPHGFTELLYAFTSASNNNGSAFAGITANTACMNTALAICMLFGRFFLIIPTLAIAGSVVRKRRVPATVGTFPTDTPLVRRPRARRGRHRRRPGVPSGAGARPDRRAAEDLIREQHRQCARDDQAASNPRSCDGRSVDSFVKLNPRTLMRNPVMFVVGVGSVLTTILFFKDLGSSSTNQNVFTGLVAAVPVVHRAVRQLRGGDGRGPRQGPGRHAAQDPLRDRRPRAAARRHRRGTCRAPQLDVGDECVVSAGEMIPSDGEVIEGIASVDESAITGESAPVIRESGGDRSAVTGGTRVLSDEIVVRITARAGRDVPRPDDRPGRGLARARRRRTRSRSTSCSPG